MPTADPNLDLTEFRRLFLDEASELTAEIENGLLSLATNPGDPEQLNSVFRAAHSIKGNAGMMGYETAAHFVHTIETILDELRTGKALLTEQLTTLLLEATDCLREILATDPRAPLGPNALAIQQDLQGRRTSPFPSKLLRTATGSPSKRYRITWKPPADSMVRGADPARVLGSICENATIVDSSCDVASLPPLETLRFDESHLSFNLVVETEAPQSVLFDTFSLLALDAQLQIENIPVEPVPEQTPARALPNRPSPHAAPKTLESTVRLSCSKLDALFDLVGEVVIGQSMMLQLLRTPSVPDASANMNPDGTVARSGQSAEALPRVLEDLERNTKELQDRMMSLRLIPLEQVFNRMPRLVRDLSTQLGKQVRLQISGAETEIDRALVDKLADPLMHLVRNCVDHGIESPADRSRAGKPPAGNIHLHAYHEAGRTVIEISDDGRGLDTGKIREKALQNGIIKTLNELQDHQLHLLIFHPGLSTADRITGVSGRGVGMDAVRTAFESMAGTVHVITERGKGTTFRMRIPITMAILDALLVRQASSILAIPVANVIECVRPKPDRLRIVPSETGAPREVFLSRDSVFSVLRLERMLPGLASAAPNQLPTVVLVEHDSQRYAIVTDDIAGQQQVLVKSLDANYRRMEGLQGAAILPDGQVALVLDLGGVIRIFENANPASHSRVFNTAVRIPERRREPAYQ